MVIHKSKLFSIPLHYTHMILMVNGELYSDPKGL